MALIKCKKCGHMISDRTKFCPHCGCPKEFSIKEESSTTEDTPISEETYANNKTATTTQDIEEYDIEKNTGNGVLLRIVGVITIVALIFAAFLFGIKRYYNGNTLKSTNDTCAVDTDSCAVVDSCSKDSAPYEQSSKHDFISFDDLLESEPSKDCHYDIKGIIEIKKALNQKGFELISTKKQNMEIEGGEIVEYIHYSYAIKTSDGDILNRIDFDSPVNGIGVDNIKIYFADCKDKEAFVEQIHNSNYVESDYVGEVGFVLGDKYSIEIYYNTI